MCREVFVGEDEGWVPPDLSISARPYDDLPIPLSKQHTLSDVECYAVLAAIHDAHYDRAVEPINPFKDTPHDVESKEVWLGTAYWALVDAVPQLESDDLPALQAILADVRADLDRMTAKENGSSEPTEGSPKLLERQHGDESRDSENPGASADTAEEPLAIDDEDHKILRFLDNQHPKLQTLVDIEAGANVTRKTAGERLTRLIGQGLAIRPKGPNGGATITSKGVTLVASRKPTAQ